MNPSDLRVMSELGGFSLTSISAITYDNPVGYDHGLQLYMLYMLRYGCRILVYKMVYKKAVKSAFGPLPG